MYDLDTNAAKEADQKNSSINESGAYTGIFTRAENVMSTKGTVGVEFSFKSDSGASSDYITLWTKNKDGKELYGYKMLMAIMTCLKVRNIKPTIQQVEKYDHEAGQRKQVSVEVFPELMNKPIGLVIQMEEYEKKDTSTAWKPSIYAPFSKEGFTASEILSNAQKPETLDKMLATLRDKPLRHRSEQSSTAGGPAPTGGFDDSIPF
jgi:hypothetical protein